MFQSKVCGTWVSNSSKMEGDVIFGEDVTKFVRLYEADRLFEKIPGREHSSFPAFEYDLNIKNPEKLKQRLKKYARKLDLTRLIMP